MLEGRGGTQLYQGTGKEMQGHVVGLWPRRVPGYCFLTVAQRQE